jgi:nucleotide-binding universal stress UspA family protein
MVALPISLAARSRRRYREYRSMFKNIVWATDGSDYADRALATATSLASESGATLLAVHCVQYLVGPGSKGALPEPGEDERTQKVSEQVAELTRQGVSATSKVVYSGASGPAHAVAEVAAEEGADLIVVGTKGHTALGGLLVGSVTQRLLHIAPCPVLVVPGP